MVSDSGASDGHIKTFEMRFKGRKFNTADLTLIDKAARALYFHYHPGAAVDAWDLMPAIYKPQWTDAVLVVLDSWGCALSTLTEA